MQTSYSFFESTNYKPRVTSPPNTRLTARDISILHFVHEMKFSTIEQLHKKFFKVTKDGYSSISLRWTKERIASLIKNDFLRPVKDLCPITLYLISEKGYWYIKNGTFGNDVGKFHKVIDSRFLKHDASVSDVRIHLESKEIATQWISEHLLPEHPGVRKYLTSEFRPDGIYTDPSGQKVAFELEIALKSKERYRQKIKRYIDVVTNQDASKELFGKVHYVCQKENVLEFLKFETQIYQSLFQFSLESEIFKPTGELL